MRRYYETVKRITTLIWVAPGAVRYDREDIDFLLPWLFEMREGAYPAEPESGYVGGGKRAGISSHAFYEAACQVAAEIDNRLARVGMDRYLVEEFYCHNLTEEDLAIRLFMPTWEIRRKIKSAVAYIASGSCPRWLNCIDCKKYQSCRRKKRVGITYRQWKGHRRENISLRKHLLTKRA
jgi:hypothetical protein